MTAWFRICKFFSCSLFLLVGAVVLMNVSASVPGLKTSAMAEEVKSGIILGNRGSVKRFGGISSGDLLRSERRRAIDARNARIARERLARRGVIVGQGISAFDNGRRFLVRNRVFTSRSGNQVSHADKGRRLQREISSRDLLNSDRRRSIDARNEQISLERSIRSAERAAAAGGGVVVVGGNRQGILTSDFNGGVAGTVLTQRTPCPRSHNCGYRLYSNGTGPRIITPGISAGGNLPEFDGLSGPQVITLD